MSAMKILLVDDDVTLLGFLGEFLQNEGFEVATASNGNEALRTAYRFQPDIAVMDVMMPGMDGWELTVRLRQLSDLPIILLSGKTAEDDKLRGFRLGVDDYVTKPFSFAELEARILSVLKRAHAKGADGKDAIPIGDLVLDMNRRELRRGVEPIDLTPTEYRLLEVLARQMGNAVAESTLVQEVWGQMRDENTAVVRRYIWFLRQKIETDPAEPHHLQTVRGFGYRLEE
jgi:two-component system KDP operon response regulator KdpE